MGQVLGISLENYALMKEKTGKAHLLRTKMFSINFVKFVNMPKQFSIPFVVFKTTKSFIDLLS